MRLWRRASRHRVCLTCLTLGVVLTPFLVLRSNRLIAAYSCLSGRSTCHQSNITAQLEELRFAVIKHMWELKPYLLANNTVVVGNPRTSKAFLLIGIATIRRINGHTYLLRTLQSVIAGMTSSEMSAEVKVVVFLADLDPAYKNYTAGVLLAQYGEHVTSGLLTILRVLPDYYPPLVGLHRNFGDSAERVRWRTKQVADYAALFAFSAGQSDYYLQLEDDVQCAAGFVKDIRHFIHKKQNSDWVMLEFSELGFIGKLFRTEDLDRLSRYMQMFYAEQPVDWLMVGFCLSMGQHRRMIRKPTLFQHFGVKSSLNTTRDNNLKDRYFMGNSEDER